MAWKKAPVSDTSGNITDSFFDTLFDSIDWWIAGPILYLVLISFVTFMAFELDKNAARLRRSRIRESTLLLFALAGGSPGAVLAQQILRHKTRKVPFRWYLWGIAMLHAVILLAVLFAPWEAITGHGLIALLG